MRTAFFDGARPRPARHGLVLAVVAGLWLSLVSASAFAIGEAHPLVTSFGSFTNPNGIAVDESTGDVYVADIGTNTVYKFDASGNPVEFSALHSNALAGLATPAKAFSFPSMPDNPAAIAVDNACVQQRPGLVGAACLKFDPSAGDLYVMDAGHNVVDKFNANGEFLSQIVAPGELVGLGVESSGHVRIDTFDPGLMNQFITKSDFALEYDQSTANLFIRAIALQHLSVEEGQGSEGTTPLRGFAVSATGDDYQLYPECNCIDRYGTAGEEFGQLDAGSEDVALATDPLTGHVFVDDQSSVMEWDSGEMNGALKPPSNSFASTSAGTQVSSFGSLSGLAASSGQGGIAVNGTIGQIYVSNPADGEVYVFASASPGVSAGKVPDITQTTATLQGMVDPRGVVTASCTFEFGEYTNPSYEHSVPCQQSPPQIGTGTSPVPVSAEISGLKAGVLYRFRLKATNAEGSDFSGGVFASASRGLGVKTFEVSFLNADGTSDVQAGSHPYEMVSNIALNTKVIPFEPVGDSRYVIEPAETLKDVIVDLPPGLVGDPNATTKKCTLAELDKTAEEAIGVESKRSSEERSLTDGPCPVESFVGWMEVEFGGHEVKPNGFPYHDLGLAFIKAPVYNMVPPHGVAAQFGVHFYIPSSFINAGVRAGGNYPVSATVTNAPAMAPVISTRLVIYGVPGSSEPRTPLLTLPTGCTGPLKSSLSIDSYQHPGQWVTANTVTRDLSGNPLALTGCSKLKFPPTITVSPDTADASTSSGLTVGVHVPQNAAFNPNGLAESSLRNTTVTLPEGVTINPAGADGLEACSEGLAGFTGFNEFNSEFEPGVKTATFTPEMPEPTLPGQNFCPDGSKIGTVKIKTPLLDHELEGAVYLAAQNANPFGSLVAMYMIAEDPVSGSLIKLTGEVKLSDTGQIVTTFKNTPDLPFEDLELHFFGGERAPLSTPIRCGTYATRATFLPWDGNGPVNTSSSFTIDHGPHGTPCPGASLPFAPSLAAGTTSNQAGGLTPFTMTMSREDGQQTLQAATLKMPPGLSGLLTGVELCGEVQANAGTCGPNSQIGETIVSVGVGNDPFSVKGGKVYLTGPYKGAPFGLSIVNPAKAGPYDLGQVVVRAKVEVDPVTADLTVISDNEGPYKIPTILDGIPLEIKHVNVTINRPGFTFNPTDCNPLSITGNLSSTEGAASPVSVPFQATNCARLSFKPSFEVSTSGKTSRLDGASLDVKLTYPKAPFGSQANIASVKVDLPKQLPSNLEALKHACIDTTFDANPAACPVESRVGSAMATTPLIPVPLSGPAYFVSHGGAKFPELIVVLQGYGVTVDLHGETFIENGITSSTFHTIPDVPVGTFELSLPQRPKFAALAAPGGLCNVTKTLLVKRKVKVRSKNGTTHTVTRKVKQTVAAGLVMPTAFNAQNGAVIHQNTPIEVTGCSAKAKKKAKTPEHAQGKHKKKK